MSECDALEYYIFGLIALLLGSVFYNLKQKQELKNTKERDAILIKRAYFNPLTDLPNRRNLDIMLEEQIHRAKRREKGFLLAVVKLINYHDINLRSSALAKEFIIEAGTRITDSVRDEDIVAHTTENGFVILFNEYLEEDNYQILFDRIQNAFVDYLEINSKTRLNFKIHIGQAEFLKDATSGEGLINEATRRALKN